VATTGTFVALEIFSQEDQKGRRREFWVRAAAGGPAAAEGGDQSNLLTF
jgi:hypothetical protein